MQSVRSFLSFPVAATFLALGAGNLFAQTKWVATWATAPEPLVSSQPNFNPGMALANNSLRQVLRVSLGGDTLRMRFTNEYTNVAVKMNAVNIAVSTGAGIIDTTTIRNFKFGGNDSVTMGANAYVWSDPVAFPLAPGMKVEITIHFGAGAPAPATYPGVTVHRGSRTTPRILAGNHLRDVNFAGSVPTSQGAGGQGSWVISSMEVRAPQSAGAVAILGNSIVDGFGTTNESFTRWTDALTTNLLAHARTSKVGVLNGGIGAGNLVSGGTSTPGLQRYKRDLFDHAGVKWIVILLGANDIGTTCSGATANNVINAYATIADSAHARGLKVYGATLTPFNGNNYYSTSSEACRQTINTWVRGAAVTTGKYDAVIDFDKIVRNPSDTTRILTTYNNDGLHPNVAGYALMGNSVDTNLFIESGTGVSAPPRELAGYALGNAYANDQGGAMIRFTVPRETFVSLKVHSVQGREVAELAGRIFASGDHVVEFKNGGLSGTYLVSMKAGEFSATRKVILPGR